MRHGIIEGERQMKKMILGAAIGLALAGCGSSDQSSTGMPKGRPDSAAPAHTAGYNALKNAYFGDLHIHTKYSFDAYIFNVRTTPADAYRYARGETIKHPLGYDLKLAGPPLDFAAVTDHAEYMGVLEAMNTPGSAVADHPMAARMFSTDPVAIRNAFTEVAQSLLVGRWIDGLNNKDIRGKAWQTIKDTADKYDDPGTFTAFTGYEFTSAPGAGNLHRNVIFEGGAPALPFSALDSQNPEKLWAWMDVQRKKGFDALSIPHNSNVSNNQMFEATTFEKKPFSQGYAQTRMRNEPLVELTQIKGTSETHPALSPNDEWAGFEIYKELIGTNIIASAGRGDYVRGALRTGLEQETNFGFNPYKFGFIGSSDTHLAGAGYREDNYFSKVGVIDGTPARRGALPGPHKTWEAYPENSEINSAVRFSHWSAAGLAGVWAEENTRSALFSAMRRKETYATSGTRIKLRFFVGKDYDPAMLGSADMLSRAYASGAAMGSTISGGAQSPKFLIWVQRDPQSAPLQRVQIIKVAASAGNSREFVYDAACAGGAMPDPQSRRCPDNGAAVNLADCTINDAGGASELMTLWEDPDFDPKAHNVYYARVMENPICRWSTFQALANGETPNPHKPATVQERAWSSPIWVNP